MRVVISGGFDPIHIGHIRLIKEAKGLGDELIVILNNNEFLIRKKGYVFMLLIERIEILRSIRGVDSVMVAIDDDDTVAKTIEVLRPDIFANGGDRTEANPEEEKSCSKIGCEMVFGVGGGKVQSSSRLVRYA